MKRKFIVKNQLTQSPGIYMMSCNGTDKVYIGETVNLSRRLQKHFSLLRKNKHSNPIWQNVFNKYGEENITVEVLEYLNTVDELELKKIEQNWQKKFPTCISLDSNEIFVVERSEEWKTKQKAILDANRYKVIEMCTIPIIVYDIVDKKTIEFSSVGEASSLIEHKHLQKNINDKILIPYKGRYVAFKKSEFKPELVDNILNTNSNTKVQVYKGDYTLYNIFTEEVLHFGSKVQFSLHFSKSKNDKLYELFNNRITIDGWCTRLPTSLIDFYENMFISIKKGRSQFCSMVEVGKLIKACDTCKTKTDFAKMCNVSRATISKGPELYIYKELADKLKETAARMKLV